jgi:hypothetical protein
MEQKTDLLPNDDAVMPSFCTRQSLSCLIGNANLYPTRKTTFPLVSRRGESILVGLKCAGCDSSGSVREL